MASSEGLGDVLSRFLAHTPKTSSTGRLRITGWSKDRKVEWVPKESDREQLLAKNIFDKFCNFLSLRQYNSANILQLAYKELKKLKKSDADSAFQLYHQIVQLGEQLGQDEKHLSRKDKSRISKIMKKIHQLSSTTAEEVVKRLRASTDTTSDQKTLLQSTITTIIITDKTTSDDIQTILRECTGLTTLDCREYEGKGLDTIFLTSELNDTERQPVPGFANIKKLQLPKGFNKFSLLEKISSDLTISLHTFPNNIEDLKAKYPRITFEEQKPRSITPQARPSEAIQNVVGSIIDAEDTKDEQSERNIKLSEPEKKPLPDFDKMKFITAKNVEALQNLSEAELKTIQSIKCDPEITPDALLSMLTRLPNLASLDISGCQNIDDATLLKIGPNKIKQLIASDTLLTGTCLKNKETIHPLMGLQKLVPKNCPNLLLENITSQLCMMGVRELDLTGAQGRFHEDLHFPGLEQLCLHNAGEIEDEDISPQRFPKLEVTVHIPPSSGYVNCYDQTAITCGVAI